MPCKVYKATSDFKNKEIADSLFLTKNSLLTVVYDIDDNWCFGILPGGSYGIVPYIYIQEEMDNDYTFIQVCLMDCDKKMSLAQDNRSEMEQYKHKMVQEALEEIRALIKSQSPSSVSPSSSTAPAATSSESIGSKQMSWAEQQAKWHSQLTPSKPQPVSKAASQQQQPSKTADQQLQSATPSDSILPSSFDSKSAAKLAQSKSAGKQAQSSKSAFKQVQSKSASAKTTQPPQSTTLVQPKPAADPTVLSKPVEPPARPPKSASPISPTLSRQLIEAVQVSTRASYHHSALAVKRLLAVLDSQTPCQSEAVDQLIEQINAELASDTAIADNLHWKALSHQFSVIDAYRRRRLDQKEADESPPIAEEIWQLGHILRIADPDIALRRLHYDNFAGPKCLADVHSAVADKPRVRLALVHCLAAMCRLDRGVVDALLRGSTLATDLLASGVGSPDAELFAESLSLLAAIFSTLIKPTAAVFDALNEKTFAKLFQRLASDSLPVDTVRRVVATILTANCVIAEFLTAAAAKEPASKRPLFRALAEAAPAAKAAFIEAILVEFNRGADPAAILDHSPPHQNSVLKILCDLTSQEAALALFKPADIHLLLDAVIREMNKACDAPASSAGRKLPAHLKLLDLITASQRYKDSHELEAICSALRKTSSLNTMPAPVKTYSQTILKRLASRKV